MKITLFLIILFWTVPLLSESYFCDPGSFEQLGIKFKKEIECAKRNKNNQIVFFKLNKKIKKSFTKYTENIKKDKDRYSNNKSAYLQQAMLKNSANKYFPYLF